MEKNKKLHNIDIPALREYLLTLEESDFQAADGNSSTNPNGIIKEGFCIEKLKTDSEVPAGKIINYRQLYLVDALGNDLSIVKHSKQKRKLPTGRIIKGEFIETVIDNCRKTYGTALNGYWIIPSQFINL